MGGGRNGGTIPTYDLNFSTLLQPSSLYRPRSTSAHFHWGSRGKAAERVGAHACSLTPNSFTPTLIYPMSPPSLPLSQSNPPQRKGTKLNFMTPNPAKQGGKEVGIKLSNQSAQGGFIATFVASNKAPPTKDTTTYFFGLQRFRDVFRFEISFPNTVETLKQCVKRLCVCC